MSTWQLHDARNKLSQVIAAAGEAPQIITVRGREAAVVLSMETYRRLTGPPTDLVTFLRQSPLVGVELDLERRGGPVSDHVCTCVLEQSEDD